MEESPLAAQWWRHLAERYPAIAYWCDHKAVTGNSWPEWSPRAFEREEQSWLILAEASEQAGTVETRRWARQARMAVLRLRGQTWRRAEGPLRLVQSVFWAWAHIGSPEIVRPLVLGLEELPDFLGQASSSVWSDPFIHRRVQATCASLIRIVRHWHRPQSVTPARWSILCDRAVSALLHYETTCPSRPASLPVVPWISRAPDPVTFDQAREKLDRQASSPALLGLDAVSRVLSTLGLDDGQRRLAVGMPRWVLNGGTGLSDRGGTMSHLNTALLAAWIERYAMLDFVLADPAALGAAVDWITAHFSIQPGPDQAQWRWAWAQRRALHLADAWLWLNGEDPERVWRWLAKFLGTGPAAMWTNWLHAEPGWALSRLMWLDLHNISTERVESWHDLLAISPAESPPYWEWNPSCGAIE